MSQRQDPRASRLTADAARKKREAEATQLRTRHREELMVKRRNLDADIEATPITDITGAVRIFPSSLGALISRRKATIGDFSFPPPPFLNLFYRLC